MVGSKSVNASYPSTTSVAKPVDGRRGETRTFDGSGQLKPGTACPAASTETSMGTEDTNAFFMHVTWRGCAFRRGLEYCRVDTLRNISPRSVGHRPVLTIRFSKPDYVGVAGGGGSKM